MFIYVARSSHGSVFVNTDHIVEIARDEMDDRWNGLWECTMINGAHIALPDEEAVLFFKALGFNCE